MRALRANLPLSCFVSGTLLLVACEDRPERTVTTPKSPVCGDGRVQEGERCDGAALGSVTCEGLGFGSGVLACRGDCAALDPASCGPPASCGDGLLQAPEVCDGAMLAGATCASLGYGPGTLSCRSSCGGFDTSLCGPLLSCGDGIRGGIEACDRTSFGGLSCASLGLGVGNLSCASDCQSVDTTGCRAASDAGVTPADSGVGPQLDGAVDPCQGVSCSGHGLCAVAGGQALCVCDSGFEPRGLDCVERVNGAPVIGSVSPNPAELSEDGSARFVVMVSDPDGLGDIGGGRLEDSTGSRLSLFSPIGPGQYEAAVTWAQLNTISTLEFVGEAFRTLEVVFFDASGNETRAQVQVRLHCDGVSVEAGACGGSCEALDSYERCGSCNLGCDFPDHRGVPTGACVGAGLCSFEVTLPDLNGTPNCQQACPRFYPNSTCGGASGSTFLLSFLGGIPNVSCNEPIDTPYPTTVTLTDLSCECRSTTGLYRTIAKPRNTTCTTLCATTYGDPCFLLRYQGIHANGQSVFGGDNCEVPYNWASWDGVGIGDVVPFQDRLTNLSCDCRVPPR